MKDLADELERLAKEATPGEWHHCQPFKTVPEARTVHGRVPAERVDYVSTWPGPGTPPGHRTVIDMPGRESRTTSEDMALIAFMKSNLPAILSALRGEWQGIETAPKSTATQTPHGLLVQGHYLLGFCPEEGADPNGCIEVIWWEPGENKGRGAWFCNGYECHPTHWRPLPPPPKGQTDE